MTRVAVVGAGIMGAATAWQLARRGADVVVHEQFEAGHDRGSSHGRTRIFRVVYPESEWIRLAQEAYAGWNELDPGLLGLYGLIEIAPDPALTSARALEECVVPHRFLTPEQALAYGAHVPEGWAALFVDRAGVVLSDAARHAFLDGIDVCYGSRVDDLDALDADVVVVTAGSWIGRFFPDLPLKVTRETVAYFRLEGPPRPSIVELDEHSAHAMFSLHDPVYGLKAGAHHAGAEADPDEAAEPDPELVERICAWVAERLPDADPNPVEAQSCLYTTTPDERFILERRGRVVIGSACSGHGFKFAPAVGLRLADLALRQ
ncbi:MAG TPA: FAD-dependent oxidoreductase [Gaiellaceae bacterium]|nr:FAD-dependent oxidoreductase [Gaiellaceae bacterium]